MQVSLLQELGILDCTVLKQSGGNTFTLLHANESWLPSILPNIEAGEEFTFDHEPVYLVDFLHDANDFWRLNIDGRVNSGIWSEQTDEGLWRLEAAAITRGEDNYLVLFNLENEYNRRQNTLQIAREQLISNDKIVEQHELVRERIESLTRDVHNLREIQLPVREVIENADFGVAIVDSDMQPLEQNPALYRLFELKQEFDFKQRVELNRDNTTQPAELLLDLCKRQFPEFQRVLDTATHWSGELYWFKPEEFSRWLHLTICPVKDEKNASIYWLFLLTDISREKYLQQSNEKLTYFDVLTDLPNRQYFWQCLENAIERNQPFFVLQLDVKYLKRINEVYGYTVGDHVLKTVVERLRALLPQEGLLARIGGNEFAAILYESDQMQCKQIADQLIAAAAEPIHVLDQYKCNVGLSIGAAHYPRDDWKAEDLMKYADLAAFEAKQLTKSSIQFYSTELKEKSRKRIELEAALREAIEEQQFELFLQPVLDLATGEIIKAEALIRWHRPGVGLVSPDEFIPVAEQTGLIVSIGQWVIHEAMLLLAELHKQQKFIKISVNLSPAQVSDRNLLEFIYSSVEKNHIDAAFLELELTEGVLVNDVEKVQIFLEEVRRLGISVAIDDFGTGYSSLSYLQKLPIDHLKIDRSFVQELTGNESDCAIVLAVIAMAKSLKLGVIAEGVENEAQQEFLRENCCQAAQGYLFSKPVPFDEFQALFDSHINKSTSQ